MLRSLEQRLVVFSLTSVLVACSHTPKAATYPGAYSIDHRPLEPFLSIQQSSSGAVLHIDPDADFSDYSSILIDVVVLWGTPGTSQAISPRDARWATRHLYAAFESGLKDYFQIVGREGPTVLRLRGAIALSTAAARPDRFVAAASAADESATVLELDDADVLDSAYLEVSITDSESDELLVASVVNVSELAPEDTAGADRAEAAIELWINGVREGLVELVGTPHEPRIGPHVGGSQ